MDLAETVRVSPESSVEVATESGPFHVGDVIADAYRIERVIGAGGMGVVYEAADLHLPRSVAIKAARFGVLSPNLRTEAQALAAIRHPAFTTVHQFGEHERVEFFVMERIFGDTLEARLDALRIERRSLRIAEVIQLLIMIADGLSAAHRSGVAHRDLKPSNILLSGERVVLVDLGLFIPEVLVGAENLPAGSVYSMAPEVALGTVTKGYGPFIDLYALGVLAYELLTGVPPYTGDSVRNVLVKHVSERIPDPRDEREEIPEELALLVRELLAKEPYNRPSSAEAVLWRLKELRGDDALRSRPTKVLVVDDDASLGEALRLNLALSFPKLVVHATTDPFEALPKNGRVRADVLLVDVDMPGINGIEVCMAMRALPPQARPTILVMSGSAGPHDISLLQDLGITHFFSKDDALFAAVGAVLGRLRCGG